MRAGLGTQAAIATPATRIDLDRAYPTLNDGPARGDARRARQPRPGDRPGRAWRGVARPTRSRPFATARSGPATLVHGVAPTSRAAALLAAAGMPRRDAPAVLQAPDDPARGPRLTVLDESSLASTTQMHDLPDAAAADRSGAPRRGRPPASVGGRRQSLRTAAGPRARRRSHRPDHSTAAGRAARHRLAAVRGEDPTGAGRLGGAGPRDRDSRPSRTPEGCRRRLPARPAADHRRQPGQRQPARPERRHSRRAPGLAHRLTATTSPPACWSNGRS